MGNWRRARLGLKATLACGLLVLPVSLSACGAPSHTFVNLTLTVPASVRIGTPVQAVATLQLSDGTSTTAGATFTVAPAALATVSTTGLVTGVGAGAVTITATVQGHSTSQPSRVQNWTSTSPSPGAMIGSFGFKVTNSDIIGGSTLTAAIDTLIRVSS